MPKTVPAGSYETAQEYFKGLDLFGQSLTFKVKGKEKFTSIPGALLTVLVLSVTLTYSKGKFEKMY